MTLLWNLPREWVADEPITKEKLNAISDNLTYLFSPSRGLATVRSGSNVTITTTTAVGATLDAAAYSLSVELTGSRDVKVRLHGVCFNNTLAAGNKFDVLIDGTIYLSTFTTTPSASGIWIQNQYVASHVMVVDFDLIIPAGDLSAGVHTFVPLAWVSAGTMTWSEAANLSQFCVGEI